MNTGLTDCHVRRAGLYPALALSLSHEKQSGVERARGESLKSFLHIPCSINRQCHHPTVLNKNAVPCHGDSMVTVATPHTA
jgi:hypothetical protein